MKSSFVVSWHKLFSHWMGVESKANEFLVMHAHSHIYLYVYT